MRRLNEELRVLTNHLNKIREDERTHIAREIHDELGQQLTVMKMDASWINKKLTTSDKPIQDKMNELLLMIDHTVKSIRRISSELRPSLLDDLGLVPAMEWHLDEFEKRSGITKEFQLINEIPQLPDNIKINIFRIFQESLTNVARHSEATHVIVRIELKNNEVILTITDNGKGFSTDSTKKKTLGILGMKERTLMIGGVYNITGVAGKGTTVSVVIPVTNLIKQDIYA
jgi:signal transduction histidine kinase